MEVRYTTHFEREAKKIPVSLRSLLERRVVLFLFEPTHLSLHTHKLSGKLKEYWAFSINHRYRIIFEFLPDDVVLFHSVGDHSIYD